MRIISGSARGAHIDAPAGLDTRPVTDKIRQSLFNIWQWDIPGCSFLDIFSGSGSMGLEALSRGAEEVVMIEKSKKACDVILNNLKKTHLDTKNQKVLMQDAFLAVEDLDKKNKQFDIIYLDPPYTVDEIFIPIMEKLDQSHLLKEDGQLVIRTKKEKEMPDEFANLTKYREKVYGISKAHFYRIKDEENIKE